MKAMAALFKSVADETRLRILLLLAEQEELCVCDLMAALDLPQSTVSRHLAYLKHAGWLTDRRGGVWMYYSLAKQRSALHDDILAALHRAASPHPDSLVDQQRLALYQHGKTCT